MIVRRRRPPNKKPAVTPTPRRVTAPRMTSTVMDWCNRRIRDYTARTGETVDMEIIISRLYERFNSADIMPLGLRDGTEASHQVLRAIENLVLEATPPETR